MEPTNSSPSPSTIISLPDYVEEPIHDPFQHVIGSYSTQYRYLGKNLGRAKNITIAANKFNGLVINPNEEISFNKIVGTRSKENGFVNAPTIFLGELTPGIGGGVCQVSSTVYAAALAAGLKIIKRNPHSRNVSYIMAGLDATVSYEECDAKCSNLDLIFSNPYSWPIKINIGHEVYDKTEKKLSISILGKENLGRKTEFSNKFSWTGEFKRKVKVNKSLTALTSKRIQIGTRGKNVVLMVTTTFPDDSKNKEIIITVYQPIDEIWEVGSDWNPSGPYPWEPSNEEVNAL